MQKPSLRERKKRERLDALIDATHDLVREYGVDGMTVEMICERVGVSTRTFFNYFDSKDDAILGIADISITESVAAVFTDGGPSGDLMDDVLVVLGDLLSAPGLSGARLAEAIDLAHSEPRLLVRHLAWMEDHRRGLEELLERRRATTSAEYSPEAVGVLAMTVTRGAFVRWERHGGHGVPGDHIGPVLADLRALLA